MSIYQERIYTNDEGIRLVERQQHGVTGDGIVGPTTYHADVTFGPYRRDTPQGPQGVNVNVRVDIPALSVEEAFANAKACVEDAKRRCDAQMGVGQLVVAGSLPQSNGHHGGLRLRG